jgi:hypothetical protein
LEELDGFKLVGFDAGLTIRREIDRTLAAREVHFDTIMEFDNVETIKRAIEVGVGVGLLPEPTVAREVSTGSLVAIPLEGERWNRPLGIIHRRGKQLSRTARRFIELLQKEDELSRKPSAAGNGDPRIRDGDAAADDHHQATNGSAEDGAPDNGRQLSSAGYSSDDTPETART